jgi:hypothetical protein
MSTLTTSPAAPTPDGVAPSALPLSLWLRIGFERALPRERCPEPEECIHDLDRPTDVFCRSHTRFLPYSTEQPSKLRITVVNLLRAAVLGAFTYSADADTAIPLEILGAVLGLALVALPLRLYPATRAIAAALWASAVVIRAALAIPGPAFHRIAGTVLLGLLVIAATWYFGKLTSIYGASGMRSPGGRPTHADFPRQECRRVAGQTRRPMLRAQRTPARAAGVVAKPAVITPGALLLSLAFRIGPADWFELPPPAVTGWLLWTALGGLLGTLFAAVFTGFLHGGLQVSKAVEPPLLKLPQRPPKVHPRSVRPLPRGSGPIAQIGHHLALASTRMATTATNLVRTSAYLAALTAARTANWTHRQVVILGRMLAATIRKALTILADAAEVWLTALSDATRVVVAPVCATAAAATLIAPSGGWLRLYLTTGRYSDLGLAVAGIIVLGVLTSVVWMALCGEQLDSAGHSAWHNASAIIPYTAAMVGIGGIVVGLPGTLGHGRIRIGAVTLGTDALFMLTYIKERWFSGTETDFANAFPSPQDERLEAEGKGSA